MLLVAFAFASPAEDAAVAELERARSMALPDAGTPYFVAVDVLEGNVSECFAEGGAIVRRNAEPHRELRAEVRTGDYHIDSSNVSSFGMGGVRSRILPIEDGADALRREIWLGLDAAYKSAVEQYSTKQAARRDRPPQAWDDFAKISPLQLPYVAPAATLPVETACTLAQELSLRVQVPGVEVGQAVIRDWQGARLTVTTEGTRAWRPTQYTVVRVEGSTTLADGTPASDSRSWVVRSASRLPGAAELQAGAQAVASWLAGLEKAEKQDDYLGPVIFEEQAAVELFSQLLAAEVTGTGAEEDADSGGMFRAGAPLSGRIGRRLLPDGWSVTDDVAAWPEAAAAYLADHEGVRPQRVELVKDGVVKTLLMSRIPSKDQAVSTGHGRSLGDGRRVAVPAGIKVSAKHLVSRKALRKQAIRLAAETGRDYVLAVRHITPPALAETLEITISGEGPPPGLGDPYEVVRIFADGRETPVRPMSFVGVDRRLLRDIVVASAGIGPVETLDGPPGPARYQVGATGGLAQVWDVPMVLVAEVELTAKTGGDPRVLKVE